MPIKVRCPECEKVLTLPDQARGKAVKCSQCEARVPVPGGKKKARPPRQKAAAKRSRKSTDDELGEDMLANLDLSRAEDYQVRVCPKCGLEVEEEDIECPKCGVDLATGRLSAEKLRKKARGGPDPDKYYEKFVGSGIDFVKQHWKFGLRTMIYLMVTSLICIGSFFMTIYCAKLPLKVFWGAIALMTGLVGPGWCWFLHTLLIEASIDKKVKLDRVRFDFFSCVALGIKFFSWIIVFSAPFQIVFGTIGGLMISNDLTAAGIVVIAIGFIPALVCFPIAMSHMAMPIEWQGWLSPKIVPMFFQGLAKPALYWTMFFAAAMLPSLIFGSIVVFGFKTDLITLVGDVNHNARVAHVMEIPDEKKKKSSGGEEGGGTGPVGLTTDYNAVSWWFSASQQQKRAEKGYWAERGAKKGGPDNWDEPGPYRKPDLEGAIVPLVLWILACAPFGFAAVFCMQGSAFLTYYHRPELNLIAEEKEVKWKRKMKHGDDPDGEIDEDSGIGTYAAGIGGTILFYVIANVILYFATGGEYLLLPRPLAQALNLINAE